QDLVGGQGTITVRAAHLYFLEFTTDDGIGAPHAVFRLERHAFFKSGAMVRTRMVRSQALKIGDGHVPLVAARIRTTELTHQITRCRHIGHRTLLVPGFTCSAYTSLRSVHQPPSANPLPARR